jgi:hypothetical protein
MEKRNHKARRKTGGVGSQEEESKLTQSLREGDMCFCEGRSSNEVLWQVEKCPPPDIKTSTSYSPNL